MKNWGLGHVKNVVIKTVLVIYGVQGAVYGNDYTYTGQCGNDFNKERINVMKKLSSLQQWLKRFVPLVTPLDFWQSPRWAFKQLFWLHYSTTFWNNDQHKIVTWNMWLGRSYNIKEYDLAN